MVTRTITTPNVTFEAFDEGRGPLVLCLHGFPDQAGSFRHQIPALVGAGYRVVAPYMRGYAPTSAPKDGRFDAMALGEDVVALLDALLAPARIGKIVTAAVPYGPQFFAAFTTNPAQIRRSWYMFFFQSPLADVAIRHDDFALVDRLIDEWSPGWTIPADDREATKACFRRAGTVESALGYYRQTMGPMFADPAAAAASP